MTLPKPTEIADYAAAAGAFLRALCEAEKVPPEHAVSLTGAFITSLVLREARERKPGEPWESEDGR